MQIYSDNLQDIFGNAIPGAQVLVTITSTGAVASIFADDAGLIPLANPFLTDAEGELEFYAPAGTYNVTLTSSRLPAPKVRVGVNLFDGDAIAGDIATAVAAAVAAADATLREDLASNASGEGSELVGLNQALNYAAGTLGGYVNDDAISPASFPWLATFDGTTNDTAAIAACFAYAASAARSVKFPADRDALIADTLNFPSAAGHLYMNGGRLLYNGPKDRPALVLGTEAVLSIHRKYLDLNVVCMEFPGAAAVAWPVGVSAPTDVLGKDGRFVGARLLNITQSTISTVRIRGFNIGLDLYAGSSPTTISTAYNSLYIGRHENNYIGICMRSVGGAIDSFVNENVFFGGTMQQRSATNALGAAYGVVFSWDKVASYRGQNNNRSYGMCFELGLGVPAAQRVPVYYDGCGSYNHFLDFRSESNNGPFAILDGIDGRILTNNLHRASLDSSAATTINNILELNGAAGNIYESSALAQRERVSWNSGRIVDRVGGRNATTVYLAGDCFLIDASGPQRVRSNAGFKTMKDHFIVPNSFGVGTLIDTSKIKKFILRHSFRTGFGGRMAVQCLDAAGGILTSAGPNHPYVRVPLLGFNYNGGSYGGSYVAGADGLTNLFITLHEDVKSIRFVVGGGTNPLHLGSLEVVALMDLVTPVGVASVSGLSVGAGIPGHSEFYSNQKPDTSGEHGVYRRGQAVLNDTAAIGAPSHWTAITNEVAYLNKAWVANANYPFIGEIAINGSNAYIVATPGTADASGGPTGTGSGIADNTVVWNYIGPKAVFATSPNLV